MKHVPISKLLFRLRLNNVKCPICNEHSFRINSASEVFVCEKKGKYCKICLKSLKSHGAVSACNDLMMSSYY